MNQHLGLLCCVVRNCDRSGQCNMPGNSIHAGVRGAISIWLINSYHISEVFDTLCRWTKRLTDRLASTACNIPRL